MRRFLIGFGCVGFAAGCASDPFAESDGEVCSALLELANYADTQKVQVDAVLIKDRGELACGYAPPEAIENYCSAILANTSMEFVNGYAWGIRKCIEKNGSLEVARVTNDWSGLIGERKQKIVELKGVLQSGPEVSLSFEPEVADNPENYYGRYTLNISH